MKAVVFFKPGDIRVIDKDPDDLLPDEVRIKVKACGVCGTDLAIYRGEFPVKTPLIIGHELSGEVVEAGKSVTTLKVGDRVCVDPNIPCHTCDYCRIGKEHLCENFSAVGVTRNGGDAEYVNVPETNVLKIPDTMSYETGAFAEPLACAINGVNLANIKMGDTVLILGAGSMGNLIIQCARLAGAINIIASEPIAYRRKLALDNGATHVIDPSCEDVGEEIKKIKRIGADVVFECAGSVKLQGDALRYVCRGGSVVWFGCSPPGKTVDVDGYYINDNEIKITGSFNNPFTTSRAIELLANGSVVVENLISHRIKLEDYLSVINLFGGSDTLKLLAVTD